MLVMEVGCLCSITHLTLCAVFIIYEATIYAGLQLDRTSCYSTKRGAEYLVNIARLLLFV